MRWRRIALFAVAGVFTLLLIAVVALFTIDLGRFKGPVETLVSNVLDRELRIAGALHVDLGRTIRIQVEQGAIANRNPGSAADADFLSFESLDVSIDAWSLLSSPPLIERGQAPGSLATGDNDPGVWSDQSIFLQQCQRDVSTQCVLEYRFFIQLSL